METPRQRDLGQARRILTRWLASKMPAARGLLLGDLAMPSGNGGSNETLVFDATWTEKGKPRRQGLVARVAPTSHRVFLETGFESQYRVTKLLSERTEVPMPRIHWYESDESVLGAPFWVMEKVEGQVPSDFPPFGARGFIHDATPEQREKLWLSAMEALTRIHRVDLGEVGFLDRPERGPTGLDQQIHYWAESFHWAVQSGPNPTAEAALAWLDAHVPSVRPTGLSWGDARIGNMMFRDFECVAVFDWEMVSLGGGLADLGWWLFLELFFGEDMGAPRLPGMGSRGDTIALWKERTGQEARDLFWYEVFAGFRLAVILQRAHHVRDLCGAPRVVPPDYEHNNQATRRLARMLELPPPGPTRGASRPARE